LLRLLAQLEQVFCGMARRFCRSASTKNVENAASRLKSCASVEPAGGLRNVCQNIAVEAVTFDAGGTLIEPWPSVGAVYAEVARDFGVKCDESLLTAQFVNAWSLRTAFRYTREEWAEVVRASFDGMADVSEELFNAIYERFAEARSWLIYDDVIPTLQKLERTGVKLAVVSNWDERLGPLLRQLGLETYFDEVIVSSRVGAHKPDGRIFHRAAEGLRVKPTEILHVGDSWREDVEGAKAAGMSAVRIRRSGVEKAEDIGSLTDLVAMAESVS
jgi:putative hydrolase of the HAD superfamily